MAPYKRVQPNLVIPKAKEHRDSINKFYHLLDKDIQKEEERRKYEKSINQLNSVLDAEREKGVKRGVRRGVREGLEEGLEKGREEGLEKGREEGLEEGLEKGLEKGLGEGIDILRMLIEGRTVAAVRRQFRTVSQLIFDRAVETFRSMQPTWKKKRQKIAILLNPRLISDKTLFKSKNIYHQLT